MEYASSEYVGVPFLIISPKTHTNDQQQLEHSDWRKWWFITISSMRQVPGLKLGRKIGYPYWGVFKFPLFLGKYQKITLK